jgi:site-specific DNA recombinase
MMMIDGVLARVAALKKMPTLELKEQWQKLFDTPPPPYNRRFLESRLAYRIQELAYGGLKPETVKRLEALRAGRTRAATPALLKGLIFGPTGCAMTPTHTRRGDKLYRYYVSQSVLKRGAEACPVGRVPAAEIEGAVVDQLRDLLRAPEVIVGTWRSARPEIDGLSEAEVREALEGLDPLWDELFPAEQARIVQLLVERVEVGVAGLKVRLRVQGLARMVQDLAGIAAAPRRAA